MSKTLADPLALLSQAYILSLDVSSLNLRRASILLPTFDQVACDAAIGIPSLSVPPLDEAFVGALAQVPAERGMGFYSIFGILFVGIWGQT